MSKHIDNWQHKDEWKREGDNHSVVISRHFRPYTGEHRWCVYLYIYPGHPRFEQFKPDSDMWSQPHYDCHSYVSLFRTHRRDDGSIGSFQLGWDYAHDGDDHFSQCATADDAGSVFWDANKLFEDASQ